MKRLYASAHLWKERDVEAPPLYGKSPLWGIRLLVAKHRYIAFGVAQRGTLSSAYPPIQPYAPLFSSSLSLSLSLARSLRTHTYRHIPARAYNTYLPRAYWRFLSFWKRAAASRVFVTRINKIFEIVQHIRQFFTREERGRFSGCQGIAGRKSEGWNLLDGMKRRNERIGIKKKK